MLEYGGLEGYWYTCTTQTMIAAYQLSPPRDHMSVVIIGKQKYSSCTNTISIVIAEIARLLDCYSLCSN